MGDLWYPSQFLCRKKQGRDFRRCVLLRMFQSCKFICHGDFCSEKNWELSTCIEVIENFNERCIKNLVMTCLRSKVEFFAVATDYCPEYFHKRSYGPNSMVGWQKLSLVVNRWSIIQTWQESPLCESHVTGKSTTGILERLGRNDDWVSRVSRASIHSALNSHEYALNHRIIHML